MSQISAAWGAGPDASYEAIAERFRPLFARIREGAIHRELNRQWPLEQIQWLKHSGFTALRVPKAYGGSEATLPQLFNLLIELGEADSNLVQAIRGHLGFVESVLNSGDPRRRERWLPRLGEGQLVGPAWSETGDAGQSEFSTRLQGEGEHWLLNGSKFYTTGSLYSDWIDVGVSDANGETVAATVARDAPGVTVLDDWNGFGQTLTASGTAQFHNVRVDAADLNREQRFRYASGFFQAVHFATLAGIGRALSGEVAHAVAARTRTYSHGNAPRASQDPQVLQVVGQLRGAAYTTGAIVLKNAEALQRAFDSRLAGDEAAQDEANTLAELEVAQSQTIVMDLILNATTVLFDALGASATLRPLALDRFWRNARTLSSHNPRIYKDRIVGDYVVNGTPPPFQWRIGVA
ncbi:acyl-CoA dehydrogenase family protein [Pseudomonas typographi]|uniref:Acyl-CoA dehydrogenase family protein n=1 Tax=Pseudomonas typographi TaxID=2715964 RepID=A0ABR7YWX4_9PSED|nr:acyl-CoA dehydrogenase family protein [Pseudomonas typographi]MBD1552618.1 acyl-CoA dehydrogenase family protein [Pseudomonas typographi]MBD1586199.1 acyl-CoA dehydrogenase family protein [Pseudomonas typographi]MBD1597670.1 acyl-CoA dehydrogenase family protein [Pseudomonas typographi]